MVEIIILQSEGASVDSFVVFLAILLLVFPVLFIRSLLKGWQPASTGALFWKALLIFTAPFYIGIIVVKVLSATGFVSEEFGQLFPSLQKPAPGFPEIPQTEVNFWSEYTVGLMIAALISGLAAILIYSFFKSRKSSKEKIGGLLFWGALYATAIIIANSAFDKIQEMALEGEAAKTQQQQAIKKKRREERKEVLGGFAADLIRPPQTEAEEAVPDEEAPPGLFDNFFRKNKAAAEGELGKKASEIPDSVIAEYLQLTNQQVQMLAGQDPLACHYFFHTGTYLRRFRDIFKSTNTDPETLEIMRLIEREMRNPSDPTVSPKMSGQEFTETSNKIFGRVRERLPQGQRNLDFYNNPQKVVSRDAKIQSCFTYLAYIDEIASLPEDEAVRYYRAVLEGRAEALNAEAALSDDQELLRMFRNLVTENSPLDILFEDNPNMKKDFVFYLLKNHDGDITETRQLAYERKKALLDANIKYYFALATDPAIYGHLNFHTTLLRQLRDVSPEICGRMAGVLEDVDVDLFGNPYAERHEGSLAIVMKSSRINPDTSPLLFEGAELNAVLEEVKAGMSRTLPGWNGDLDLLLEADARDDDGDQRRACRLAEAFYPALTGLGQEKASALMRGLLLEEEG